MSFFTIQTLTVDLGDGNTVTLKKLSAGEANAAMSAATSKIDLMRSGRKSRSQKPTNGHKPQDEPEQDIELTLDLHRLGLERTARAIVAWEGEGFMEDGELVPVTVENVKRLPEEIANRLFEAMGQINPQGTSEEELEKNAP